MLKYTPRRTVVSRKFPAYWPSVTIDVVTKDSVSSTLRLASTFRLREKKREKRQQPPTRCTNDNPNRNQLFKKVLIDQWRTWTLLGAKGVATWSKDATRGSRPYY